MPAVQSTGNPYWNVDRPRASLLPRRRDDMVRPASYGQPLAPIPTPTPAVTPLSSAPAGMTDVTIPAPLQPVAPAAPPQMLSGLALLTERPLNDAAAPEHPLAPVIRWAENALGQLQGLRDYTCTFSKREWVDGALQDQQVLYAKVRREPFSVYLQFLSPTDVKGQEALYVEGRNGGNLLAHPVGLRQAIVGTISIAPTSEQAMEGNRHPITDFGFQRLLERYLDGARLDSQYGECDVRIIENARVGDRTCTCIEVSHPQPRAEFRYHICRLYVDQEWNIPARYECYDWPQNAGEPPRLIEEYTYQGVRLNVGLGDAEFDTRNPNYRF